MRTLARILVGILLLMALMVMLSEVAEAADYQVSIGSSPGHSSSVSGDPGETIKLYIRITNEGSQDDEYELNNSSLPTGWKLTIAQTIGLAVDSGLHLDIVIQVTSDDNSEADEEIDFYITVTSMNDPDEPPAKASLLLTYSVNQVYDIAVSVDPDEESSIEVDPGKCTYFLINVSMGDNANGEDTITLSKEFSGSGSGWIIIFSSNQVTLDPGEYVIINVSVCVPNDADAGQSGIDIIGTSKMKSESDSTTIIADVTYEPDFIVLPYGPNQKRMEPKECADFGVSIQNKGNDEDTFSFKVRPGDWQDRGWSVSIYYSSITVGQNDEIDLEQFVSVCAPDGLADEEATIVINVTSGDGTLLKTLNIRVKISQEFDPAITISGGTIKSVDPGIDANFTIQVTNNGNGEDEITLSIWNDDQTPGSWGYFSEDSVTLQAHANTTVTLTVTPPSGTAYLDEGYTLQIFGTSEDGENVTATKTLKVNVKRTYGVSVSIDDDSTKRTDPGEDVKFTVTVMNRGNCDDSYVLDVYGKGTGWKPGWAFLPSEVDVDEGENETVTLTVSVPDETQKGTYFIGIRGTSDGDPSSEPVNGSAEVIVHVNQSYAISLSIPASQKTVDVDSSVWYDIVVKNTGTGNHSITLAVSYMPDGWQVNFNRTSLHLGSGESGYAGMVVTTPEYEEPDVFFVNLTASSDGAPGSDPVVVEGSTRTTVNQYYDFGIWPGPDYRQVMPGETVTFNITIENRGSGDDDLSLAVSGELPEGWSISFVDQVSLDRNETEYRTLTVVTDEDTPHGNLRLFIRATSEDDPNPNPISRTVEISLDVDVRYELTIRANEDTRSGDPFPEGEVGEVVFELNVTNMGTGNDSIDLTSEFDDVPERLFGWEVRFTPDHLSLGPKESGTVQARVRPAYRESVGTYGLTVTATTDNDPLISQDLRLFVQVNETYDLDSEIAVPLIHVQPSIMEGNYTRVEFDLAITNTGTVGERFLIDIEDFPDTWLSQVPKKTSRIGIGETLNMSLIFDIPGRESPGTRDLGIVVRSETKPVASENYTIEVHVNKLYAVTIGADYPLGKGDPEMTTEFLIWIRNRGTVGDSFKFGVLDEGEDLFVSFPDGIISEEIGPGNETEVTVSVFVNEDTGKGKAPFTITATSVGDENVSREFRLIVDVNQSYGLQATLTGSPPENKGNPDTTVTYLWAVKNIGTGTDTISIDIPKLVEGEVNVPDDWKVTARPNVFELDAGESKQLELLVEIDDDALPDSLPIAFNLSYHDGSEEIWREITVNVNQSFDVKTNLDYNLLQIFPGFNQTATLFVKNTGTGWDYYRINVSENSGISVDVRTVVTKVLEPGDSTQVSIDFFVEKDEYPHTKRIWINVTSLRAWGQGLNVVDVDRIDVKVRDTFGVVLNRTEGIYSVYPTIDSSGVTIFTLRVTNTGTTEDTFNFEFSDDNDTRTYKKWITLPNSIHLGPNSSTTVEVDIDVDPYSMDTVAIADGLLKNVTFMVYSKGANDSNVVIEGVMTKDFVCGILVEEYHSSSIEYISPSSIQLVPEESGTISVEVKNGGNGFDEFSLVSLGRDGGGEFADWLTFNETSVVMDPGEMRTFWASVSPLWDAPAGVSDLAIVVRSGEGYESDPDEIRIDVEEIFGGYFVSGENGTGKPGDTVQIKVMVNNTGNDQHDFMLDDPIMPYGWTGGSWIASLQSISGHFTREFTFRIRIPADPAIATIGSHTFMISGRYEDRGGSTTGIEHDLQVQIIVEAIYGVDVQPVDPTPPDADPGSSTSYTFRVTNLANFNATYRLELGTAEGMPGYVAGWGELRWGNEVSVRVGESAFPEITIDIPEFDPEDPRALEGRYRMVVTALSITDESIRDSLVVEFDVGPTREVLVTGDVPEGKGVKRSNKDLEVSYDILVMNLGNANDSIELLLSIERDPVFDDNLTVLFDGMMELAVRLGPLESKGITMTLITNVTLKPEVFPFYVIGSSTNQTFVQSTYEVFLNVSIPPIAIISSLSPTAYLGQEVFFSANAFYYRNISRYAWSSDMDGELYLGNDSSFTFSELTLGTHIIFLLVEDVDGVWSDVTNESIRIHERPVVTGITVEKHPFEMSESITCRADASDDSNITLYEWTSNIVGLIYSGPQNEISYFGGMSMVGENTIFVRVMDEDGAWSRKISSLVRIDALNRIPGIEISDVIVSRDEINKGETVSIAGTASDDDGSIVRVELSIDEGPWNLASGTDEWNFTWDTRGFRDGEYPIRVRSYDGRNYSMTSLTMVQIDGWNAVGNEGGEGEDDGFGGLALFMLLALFSFLVGLLGSVVLSMRSTGSSHGSPGSQPDKAQAFEPQSFKPQSFEAQSFDPHSSGSDSSLKPPETR